MSWILARLWNCMLSKEEGLKVTKEKRQARQKQTWKRQKQMVVCRDGPAMWK